jgi:uncharacterized protein (TIGR03000 family)
MRKFHRSAFTVASLSALAFAFGGAQSALANSWGSHGSSGGSHGSSGGSWGSHGSSGGSHGSIGGLFRRHGSHGSSGGSWGSHGSSGGSWGSHGSSGGSWGSYGSSGGSYGSSGGSWGSYGSGGGYYTASYTAAPIATAVTAVAYLNVKVPGDAKVYLQDQLMTIPGTQRRFVTPAIQQGYQSNYTVKVEVVRNGQTITKTAQATVSAGQEVDVVVSFDGQNPKELVTSVIQTASR